LGKVPIAKSISHRVHFLDGTLPDFLGFKVFPDRNKKGLPLLYMKPSFDGRGVATSTTVIISQSYPQANFTLLSDVIE